MFKTMVMTSFLAEKWRHLASAQ